MNPVVDVGSADVIYVDKEALDWVHFGDCRLFVAHIEACFLEVHRTRFDNFYVLGNVDFAIR